MSKFLNRTFKPGGDAHIYFNDTKDGVSMGAIAAGLAESSEIVSACRAIITEMKTIGGGEHVGQFLLLEAGLNRVTSVLNELFPDTYLAGRDIPLPLQGGEE